MPLVPRIWIAGPPPNQPMESPVERIASRLSQANSILAHIRSAAMT